MRARAALASLALAVAAGAAAPAGALAFGSVCSAVGEPWANPPCPVFDTPHETAQGGTKTTEDNLLTNHKQINTTQGQQQQIVGPQGPTGQGTPQKGMDMSNGQTTQSQSMGVQTGQVANFYFGPPQGTQDMTIGGATPSNYTAAAKDSSSADVKATSFALQSEQQIQKDVKEVQQLESEAKSPKNEREDLGFRNKVANKLAQEVALKNALIGWILTIQAKRTAFHLVSDGTPDSTDKVAQGTSVSGSGTPGSTGGSSTTPSTTSSTTPTSMSASTSLTSPAATYATGSGLSASATQAIAQAVAQAQQAIAASTAANQQTAAQNQADAAGANPASVAVRGAAVREVAQALTPGVAADAATTAAAEAVVASFETSGGGTTDRLRTLTLQVANDPSAFGVTSSTDQAGLYDALATYGAAKGW